MNQNDDVLEVYLEETVERLDSIESGLLAVEKDKSCQPRLVNQIFRDAHSVKAGANLLELRTIEELAHVLENVLEQIRQRKLTASEIVITACLEAVDKLRELVDNVEESDTISILLHKAMLERSAQKTLEEQSM